MSPSSSEREPEEPRGDIDTGLGRRVSLAGKIADWVVPILVLAVCGAVFGYFFNMFSSLTGESWSKADARKRMRTDTDEDAIRRAIMGAGIGGVIGLCGSLALASKRDAASPEGSED